jgi:hypothetical protein
MAVERVKPAEAWVKKQLGNLAAVGESNYRAGVVAPKRPIVATSIAKEDKYAAKMREVLDKKLRVAGLQGVTDDQVINAAVKIGAPRLVPAVQAREEKVRKFVSNWQPILASIETEVDTMPDTTDAEREQRMLSNLRGLKAKAKAWKRAA